MCYSLTLKEKKTIEKYKEAHEHICYYCGKPIIDKSELTVDHKLPLSRDGKTEPDNLCICCSTCNCEKDNCTEEEYRYILENIECILHKNIAYQNIMLIKDNYKSIIKTYNELGIELSKCTKEKNDIETIIRDEVCNASEGYLLYRDLKDSLIKIQNLNRQRSDLYTIYQFADSKIKEIEEKLKSIRSLEVSRARKKIKEEKM